MANAVVVPDPPPPWKPLAAIPECRPPANWAAMLRADDPLVNGF